MSESEAHKYKRLVDPIGHALDTLDELIAIADHDLCVDDVDTMIGCMSVIRQALGRSIDE